ncbi:DNA translocase FtsK [Sporolactobacillus spathodeae]|uniref:S-DNA-T family DNA segregation ATPase FtsK/SpoIIIE n=1 Tax=Sporolactobacillus spathodeae TaxID=1465502 RepID=A0ABS2QBD0_9BACL|nr:DNA translocase FtsK [Sporolactobacillus spathodeae]MBM7658886.1 S-DNA-T family DNA segregation ATPase FtsK/SpoIIIE [Sporolactobacillus spathodeae]
MMNWWQRLFGDDSDPVEQKDGLPDEREQRPILEESPFALRAGRFEDRNRRAAVKMMAQYPAQRQSAPKVVPSENEKSGPSSRQEKSITAAKGERHYRQAATDAAKLSAKKSKQPFKLTKVPSPVFGYRKPPDNFYRDPGSEGLLSRQKEAAEKRQIQEVQARQQIDQMVSRKPLHSSELERPALERLSAHEAAKHKQLIVQETVAVPPSADNVDIPIIAQERNSTEAQSAAPTETAKKADEKKEWMMPVTTRLPHSTHRPAGSSNIPFNVLMFHSDRSPAAQGTGKAERPFVHKSRNAQTSGLQLPLDLLDDPPEISGDADQWIDEKKAILAETLSDFHVSADIIGFVQGPSITRFDIHLHPGVKMSKVVNLTEDIKLSLAVKQIRIAPVPGKSAVGIEIPNEDPRPVVLKEIIRAAAFSESKAPLTAALGEDVSGKQVMTDLAKMPHGLIAGATGSGKSVCIHSLIISLIYRTRPEDLRLLLVDPKVVELAPYKNLPHLAAPVLTEPRDAALALKWAVEEMEKRYRRFAGCGVRDIRGYNRRQEQIGAQENHLPYLIIIIDELADLMMVAPQDVEESVCRIAQKARAAGIHLLLATQRPSVDVITGLIKSNIPTRIAFSVSSQTDSRTILDAGGADRLLGRGDMLFMENGTQGLKRIQGCFVSDEEIRRVTDAFDHDDQPEYLFTPGDFQPSGGDADSRDELFEEAAVFVVDQGQASVSSIQRHFRVGYPRAARLVDELESRNVISGANGSKPRQVLVNKESLQELVSEGFNEGQGE